jgi:hypothetical protein
MSKNNNSLFKDLNEILPVGAAMVAVGVFFTIFSVVFTLIIKFSNEPIAWLIGLSTFAFIIIFICFFLLAYRRIILEGNNGLISNIKNSYTCAQEKSNDGFHYSYGLLNYDELIDLELRLSKDVNPEKCKVLIYTSDLATELDASNAVKENRDKNIQYIVLYFTNSCNNEQANELFQRYGIKNLIDLSTRDAYKGSFDSELAETIGFDIIIYENSDGEKQGYFCVDFTPSKQKIHKERQRPEHIADCRDKCNYEKRGNPFYKRISKSITETLYDEIMLIFAKGS